MPIIRENVISCLHHRVAREPALGVVPLLSLRVIDARLGGPHATKMAKREISLAFYGLCIRAVNDRIGIQPKHRTFSEP